jgi:DNA invertase Pin-like site-specific DNA recombinase
MDRTVETVEFQDNLNKELKVAAYARVSAEKDAMMHSLASQVSYFKTEIAKHPNWKFVEVYSDEAITGTKDNRENFQRMISDAKKGKMDLILVKSISRFARNTLTLLSTIRELKDIGVDVYFEKENIHSISFGGELLMSILASYAQEESRSVSENMKWRVKRNFESGIGWGTRLYGYKVEGNEKFTIVEDEAFVIRKIYNLYLNGDGVQKIANALNKQGYTTRNGSDWSKGSVRQILTNEYYTGNRILQKTYRVDHITKKKLHNNGEKPKYYIEESHEGIISKEDFEKVQEIFKSKQRITKPTTSTYSFTGKILCGTCGSHYKRKVRKYGDIIWQCRVYDEKGKAYCASKSVPEYALKEAVKRALLLDEYREDKFLAEVENIKVCKDNALVVHLKNEQDFSYHWEYKSRSESWTPEMKEKARIRALENNKNKMKGDDGKWLKQLQ